MIRCVGVLIAICAWIAVSNHYAFAAVATQTTNGQTDCPFHSKPAKQKEPSSQVQCCKVLRAIVSDQSKVWVRDGAKFSAAVFFVQESPPFASALRALLPLKFDMGLPKSRSFAELILQRSLFAHAPPPAA